MPSGGTGQTLLGESDTLGNAPGVGNDRCLTQENEPTASGAAQQCSYNEDVRVIGPMVSFGLAYRFGM